VYRMGSALLSRFDLVFILLDKPDEVQQQYRVGQKTDCFLFMCCMSLYALHEFSETIQSGFLARYICLTFFEVYHNFFLLIIN